MSITASAPVSHTIAERVFSLLDLIFAKKPSLGRLYSNLKGLPDHLLLDIGVDPRNVPSNEEEVIARPDLAHRGLGTTVFRTNAKS